MLNNKRFSKNKKYITIRSILACGVFAVSILCSLFLACPNVCIESQAKSTALADSGEILYDSDFMYSPIQGVTLSNGSTIVLDNVANSLVTLKDGQIKQSGAISNGAYNANNLYSLNDYLVLINPQSTNLENKIVVLDSEEKERQEIICDHNTENLLLGFENVSAIAHESTLHMFFYNNDFTNGAVYVTLEHSYSEFTLLSPRLITFTPTIIDQLFNNFMSLCLCYDADNNNPYVIVHSGNSLFEFSIEVTSDIIAKILTTTFTIPQNSKLHSFVYDETPYLFIETNGHYSVYKYDITDIINVFSPAIGTVQIENTTIDNVSLAGNAMTFVSREKQEVFVYTITNQSGEIKFEKSESYSNPEIYVDYMPAGEIMFSEVVNSTTEIIMRPTPYSQMSVISLDAGTKIVQIGSGFMSYNNGITREKVYGYEYYLYTSSNGVNYYGFVEIDKVSDIETPEADERTYVYARGNSPIFRYPTRTTKNDDKNAIIYTTTDLTRLEVKRNIENFSYITGNATSTFYEVEVNGTIGYIESINTDITHTNGLVQTNAVVLRTSVIYTNPEVDITNTVYTLHEATRVRILENRKGNEKYTKIAFNDSEGNYYTGYILSENVKADSWSSMQLIGLFLVVFSVILLGVILIVRNRINHE